ncbi:hypothetical protein [Halocatena marina]|uniref:Uncharacterized protein n=1 Tax=Halocatena marina TaxID=2934937 RepID=A0ABD5YPF1_9EURY|nr:hypothetical protein [Halocatena marina]
MSSDDLSGFWVLIGTLAVLVITWHVFWDVIQPILVNLSPIFEKQSGGGRVGRYPDTLAQVALFATILIGLLIYYLLLTLIFDGVSDFIKMCKGIIVIFKIPIFIINKQLPKRFKIWDEDDF